MTSGEDREGGRGAFEASVNELIRCADADGVDVEGAWRCSRNGEDGWEVLISEVVADDGASGD
jgi:hypothetical protein